MSPDALQKEKDRCTKKHGSSVAACETGVAHEIRVACDQVYVDQTGLRFSEGATERRCNVHNKTHPSLLSRRATASPAGMRAHFLCHELDHEKCIINDSRRMGLAGNCSSYVSVVFNIDTMVFLGLKEGEISLIKQCIFNCL